MVEKPLLWVIYQEVFKTRFGMAKKAVGVHYHSFWKSLIDQYFSGSNPRILVLVTYIGSENYLARRPSAGREFPLAFGAVLQFPFLLVPPGNVSVANEGCSRLIVFPKYDRIATPSHFGPQMLGLLAKQRNRLPSLPSNKRS